MSTDNFDKPDLLQRIELIESNLASIMRRNTSLAQLSNASDEIGDLDFRAKSDLGDVRMIMSAVNLFEEFGVSAHFAGFSPTGAPTIWIDADTGVVNLTQVNFNGSTLLESLVQLQQAGWIIQQTATVGSETRVLRMGLQDNGTYAEGRIEFNEPSSTSIAIPNGDFETLDLSDWVQTIGVWSAAGGFAFCSASMGSKPKLTSANKIAITAGTYAFVARSAAATNQQYSGATTINLSVKVDVNFYTAANVLVSTVNVGTRTASQYFPAPSGLALGSVALGWGEVSANILVPATATQFEIVGYVNVGGGFTTTLSLDDFTCVQLANQSALIFRDDGLYYASASGGEVAVGGSSPKTATMWADEVITTVPVVKTMASAQPYNYFVGPVVANANNGDEYNYGFYIAAGVYTLSWIGVQSTICGKADIYIDGVLVASALNWAGAVTYNTVKTASVTIASSGYHNLLVKVNGTTGTDYVLFTTKIYLTPSSY